MLAGGKREAQARHRFVLGRRGARAADRADRAAGDEAVEPGAAAGQAIHLDVHRMRMLGPREKLAAPHADAEVLVFGQLPAHGKRHGRQAAAALAAGRRERVQITTESGRGMPLATPR